jgi:soluble lytic murein transglycosylase-like protein
MLLGAPILQTRQIVAVPAEDDAELHRAILDHVARRNPQAPLDALRSYPAILVTESRRTRIDHCLSLAQAEVESKFKPSAVGSAGEIGLYQILPSTAALFEPVVRPFRRPRLASGRRDLGDLADPVVSTRFAMAYLRDIMTRRATTRDVLTEYNGGPGGRHPQYYQQVMGSYVETLENPDLRCRFRPVPASSPRSPLIAFFQRP